MMLWGDEVVHGAAAHRLALPLFPYSGTLIPSVGMEKVWPTPLPAFELMTLKALPFKMATPPIVPCTMPICWLRSGLPESYW